MAPRDRRGSVAFDVRATLLAGGNTREDAMNWVFVMRDAELPAELTNRGFDLYTVRAWDYPVRPWLYSAYTRLLPRLLDFLRRRGQAQTKREVSL